jgi:hypothetical protein
MMQKHTLQPNKKMKEIFFYLNASKARKEKYRQAKNQEKQFWPKSQIAKNRVKNHTLAIFKNNDSHTCLKTFKKISFFFSNFYDNFLTEKKQAKGKMNPKLLTAHTEIQMPERKNSYQGKG